MERRRARRPVHPLYLGLLISTLVLGLLVVDALNVLTETIELGGWARWLSFDDGRLATLLMGGLSAGAGLAAFRCGAVAGSNKTNVPRPAVWFGFGLGCLLIGALDVANVEPAIGWEALLGSVPLLTGAIIAWCLRGRGLVFWLMAAGLVLIAISPVIGLLENHLLTNPGNYTPGAPGLPYPYIHGAWVELWWVSRAQELAELGSMACFLLALDGVPAKREPAH